MSKFNTEQSVKAALGIVDWRNLSKDKVMQFVSVLPEVDSEVAIKIIEQFPEFAKTSQEIVSCMKELCNSIIEENKHSSDQSIQAYQQILDDLSTLLKKENIDENEKKHLLDKMIEVADKISAKDTENKELLNKLFNTVGSAAGITLLIIGVSILGAKYININKK